MKLLDARGLTRTFGDFTAVAGVDLAVGPGEVVGLLGANGAGKTTFIRMALGLLRPSAGEIMLFGSAPSLAARRRIGYVPQSLGLYDDLTVEENLRFNAAAFGVRPRSLEGEPAAVKDRLVRTLPLGMQRRVAFVVAFSHAPDLLVLDEPTSGVGALARARLWEGIRSAADDGAGVLVTTHRMSEAEQCDRVAIMSSGRVVAGGALDEVTSGDKVVEVRTEHWADAFAALDDAGLTVALRGRSVRVLEAGREEVREVLEGCGIPAELETVPADFEEAFVALTRSAA